MDPLPIRAPFSGMPPRRRMLMNLVGTALFGLYLWIETGWVVALAVLFGIVVHELGHVLAMNALGCGPARFHIVPFFGGAAVPARESDSEYRDVLISLAGPVFGLLAAAPFVLAAAATGRLQWIAGALAIAALNLVNLAPAPPLDGSKALGPSLARIHPQVERAALIAVGALAVLWALSRRDVLFGAFVGLGLYTALQRPRVRPPARKLSNGEWSTALALYGAAVAACVLTAGISLWAVGLPADPGFAVTMLGLT
jgi:Zn-dependent protease